MKTKETCLSLSPHHLRLGIYVAELSNWDDAVPAYGRTMFTTTRPSDGARSTAIYALRQRRSRPAATTADNATARASNGARSIAIYTKTARSRPAATSGDRRRPAATTANNATARPSDGARSIANYTKTAPQPTSGDQRRQQPTTQPPEPLTERDLLQFTLRQRAADQRRPAATSGDNSQQRNRQTL